MNVFTITADDAQNLENFFSKESLSNIGKDGVYTIGAYDDEGFITGVLQFIVDFNQDSPCFGFLSYMYIHEDFRDTDAAQVLVDEFESILAASDINDRFLFIPVDSNLKNFTYYNNLGFKISPKVCYSFSATIATFLDQEFEKKAGTRNIRSISELDEESFYKLQKETGCRYPVRSSSYYDMELSSFFNEDEGCGIFLVKKSVDGQILTTFLGCSNSAVEKYIIRLLTYTAKKALELYGPDALVTIHCKKSQSKKIITMLFPHLVPTKYLEATIRSDESEDNQLAD